METVFNPQQAMTLAVQSVEERRFSGTGIKSGIPGLDDIMLPMKRGDLVIVLGYTSNGKSMVMSNMANHALTQLKEDSNEIVIYISWEQSVEEQTLLDISRMSKIPADTLYRGDLTDDQWMAMVKGAVGRAAQPLWLIGHSDAAEKRRPRLSMSDVAKALDYIVDVQQKKPMLIVLDYLQRINRNDCKTQDARMAYMDIVDRIKDMALAFSCPVVLGCQAGRGTQSGEWRMPGIDAGQETSNVEQSADKFISVWMPKTCQAQGTVVNIPGLGTKVPVSDGLLFLELKKNKYGAAPRLIPLLAKPEIGKLYRLNLDTGDRGL